MGLDEMGLDEMAINRDVIRMKQSDWSTTIVAHRTKIE